MQTHDEERDIYGAVYVQGQKYFLLNDKPSDLTWEDHWMPEGMMKWLVANTEPDNSIKVAISDTEEYEWIPVYTASNIYFNSSALIDLLPVPLTKKVIRFYVTDDEEA